MTAALLVRVNLLGRDHVLRRRQRRLFQVQLALSVALGLGVAVGWLVWQREELVQLRDSNAAHTQELARLAPGVKQATAVQQALLVATQRRTALQTLEAQRQAPAQRWVDLARSLPPGVRFKQMKQDGEVLLVTGTVASGTQLAALMTAWSAPTQAWQRAELVNLTAVANPTGLRVATELTQQAETAVHRPGELDFAVRLLFQPAPVPPVTPTPVQP